MSDATTTPATPAAPAAATEAPATAAVETTAAPEAPDPASLNAKANRDKARDAAGRFFSSGGLKAIATEKGVTPPAAPAQADAQGTETLTKPEPPKPKPEPEKTAEPDPEAASKAAEKEAEDKRWKEIRRRKRQQKEEHAALLAEKQSVAAEKQRLQAVEAERIADEKLKLEQPHAWLEKHKFDFREVALREVQKQQLTPEQKAAKEENEALRAELAAEREAREKFEREAREAIDERKREKAAKEQADALVKIHTETKAEWSQAKEAFPTLAAYYTPEEISEAATQLRLDHYRKTQREATLDDVFDFMEKNARREHERFSRQQVAERTELETVATEKVAKTRAKVGPPVTNQVSATRASPPKPMTADERRRLAVQKAGELLGPRH